MFDRRSVTPRRPVDAGASSYVRRRVVVFESVAWLVDWCTECFGETNWDGSHAEARVGDVASSHQEVSDAKVGSWWRDE